MALKINAAQIANSSFMEAFKDIAEDEAMEKITQCEIEIKDILDRKKNDDQLVATREVLKRLSKPYSVDLQKEKAKIEFLLEKIEAIRAAAAPTTQP